MAYPDELLVPGEEIIMHRHPHWKMMVVPVVVLLLVVALVIRFTLMPLIRWRTTHFVITNRRVLVREGLITRRGMDIPLRRITGVQFRQSLFERLFGVGTLVMESASDEPLEFEDVPGIEEVHGLLYQEVAKGT